MGTTALVVTLAFLTLLVVLGVSLVGQGNSRTRLRDRDDSKSTLTVDGADRRN